MQKFSASSLILVLLLVAPAAWAQRYGRFVQSSQTDTPSAGDYTDGEVPEVRRAALQALGDWNGAIVAIDADTGQALTIVNQKLALADGYIPCSTIKLTVGLAAQCEEVVEAEEQIQMPGNWRMSISDALAISNNVIFEKLGSEMGFEALERYARLFGLGEKAGWKIPGEQGGLFPTEEHKMGVGRMSSFGEGINMTPLQLAALTAAIANGGSLYYIQHPRNAEEASKLRPRTKRKLPIFQALPDIWRGMGEAVRRGTGRNAQVEGLDIYGKTGTCSHYDGIERTRMGWFTSFARNFHGRNLVVTVMLRGTSTVYGPLAAQIAGKFYSTLNEIEGQKATRAE